MLRSRFARVFLAVSAFLLILPLVAPAAKPETAPPPARRLRPPDLVDFHPAIFEKVETRLSDTREPVVTEISLDAVAKDRNQFPFDRIRENRGFTRYDPWEERGFLAYRVLESRGDRHRIEFHSNGGGTLTTCSIIDFEIDERTIEVGGRPERTRVLRVLGIRRGPH